MRIDTADDRRRRLASDVRRLRVAATSDPERTDELADALVELTAARLLAWDLAEAAADAPEAVLLSARILASRGPSGPYASVPDAVRYASATVHLAAVQAGLGQPDAAGRTLAGLDAWQAQLGRLPLAGHLPDAVAAWALVARARAALDTDPSAANAHADAAEVALHAAASPPAYLAVAVHLLTADCRWAAGWPESSLAHHRLALDAHTAALAGLGEHPRPAVARAALAPTGPVHERYAQRLAASGDPAGGIAVRRAVVALREALGDGAGAATARSGLAAALAAEGRAAEVGPAGGGVGAEPAAAPGPRLGWETPVPADPAALARWRAAEQAAVFAGVAARAEAERSEAALRAEADAAAVLRLAEVAEAERRAEAEAAAGAAEREAAERREREAAAERAGLEAAAARAEAEERRRLLAEEHRATVDPARARAAAARLDDARRAVRTAEDEPVRLAAATQDLADLLRPLAAADPAHRPELAAALEELVGLRWRLGDAEGSRAAAREARAVRG